MRILFFFCTPLWCRDRIRGYTVRNHNLQRVFDKYHYSTLPSFKEGRNETRNPWFVTGLTDDEGCFNVSGAQNAPSTLG